MSSQGRFCSLESHVTMVTAYAQPRPEKSQSNILIIHVIQKAATPTSCHHGNLKGDKLYCNKTD